MEFVSSKTSSVLSFKNIPYGALVELRSEDEEPFYAIKCRDLYVCDFYMNIEDGNLYDDIDCYSIIRIINAKIVEEDD